MRSDTGPHRERRWLILGVIAIAQLMVVLDATVVNIALPSAQRAIGFSDDSRQWIITAYALTFGSLLLLGGRLGDLFGRKWTFTGGLIGFATASAVGGAAGTFGVLVAARAAQGLFGAVLAPSALALLSTTFTDAAERAKAFGIFSAIAAGGAAVGLLLGGVLTEWLSWRWCLYVNLLFALPAALAAIRLLANHPRRDRPPLDLPGTASATLGLFALVYGFSHSETTAWGNPVTIVALSAAVLLLALFVALEARAAHPLLPLHVVRDRTRGGAYLALGFAAVAMFRRLPLPDLLPAAHQRLLADPDWVRLPTADSGDHDHRSLGQRRAPAPRRAAGTVRGRHAPERSGNGGAGAADLVVVVRRAHPAGAAARRRWDGQHLRHHHRHRHPGRRAA
jgi:MFS family permease